MKPANFHKLIARDYRANLEQRRKVLLAAKTNKNLQKGLREVCKHNLLFWVSLFVWQSNAKEKKAGVIGPFIAWDFQEEALKTMLWCVDNDEDLLIVKSRQMGGSWLLVILFVWLWLYRPHVVLLFISKDEPSVDSENPISLFWKVDFILKYLPRWMLPKAWRRRKLFFGNDDLGGSIFGQASTGRAAVGGTLTAMGIDEFSQIKEDYEVLSRTADATGCRIFNGTHLGLDTAFFELSCRVDLRQLMMHWTQHPKRWPGAYKVDPETGKVEHLDKQYDYGHGYEYVTDGKPSGGPFPYIRSPWYDRECRRPGRDGRSIAQDLDIDAKGSVTQFFDPVMIRMLKDQYCREPFWEGDIAYDPDSAQPTGLVKVPGGPLKLWCHLDADGRPLPAAYKFGADISTGQGATESCASGLNPQTGEKVLEYGNAHLRPEQFAPLVVALCRWFRDENGEGAELVWEMQGPGLTFGKRVLELGYANIYYRQAEIPTTTKTVVSSNPGWYNSGDSKRLLLEEYRAALHSRQFINRSWKALAQCLDYKWTKKGTIEHALEEKDQDPTGTRQNHGDHVIADGLACKLMKPGQRRLKEKAKLLVPREGSFAWRRWLVEEQRKEREETWA